MVQHSVVRWPHLRLLHPQVFRDVALDEDVLVIDRAGRRNLELVRKLDDDVRPADGPAIAEVDEQIPVGPGKLLFSGSHGALARAIEGWQVGWVTDVSSGVPVSIAAQNMLYGNGTADIAWPKQYYYGRRRSDH